ncbi:MAG: hypothetical protein FJ358_01740 [Thaumarchaeota archaeon]|nr:hypothetical protein [Nitrososphaerota archaeon]
MSKNSDVIITSITAGLDEILGERLRASLLQRIELEYGLKVEDIPIQSERFIDILRSLFGSGGFAMENIIVKHLSTNAGIRKRRLSEMIAEILGRS